MKSIGIVGAGLAGVTLAQSLRNNGYDGSIHLFGAEPEIPYDRPPLSKAYLVGDADRSSLTLHEPSFYEDNDIDLRTDCVVDAIEPARTGIRLATGHRVALDFVALATGGRPRPLPIEGATLDGVAYLRTLADADKLRHRLRTATSIVVVGGGFIGSEIAATAKSLGKEVTIVEQAPRLLPRVVPSDISDVLEEVHRNNGVRVLCRRHIQRMIGDSHVRAVELSGDLTIAADLVVVGIGMLPNDELAQEAGLTCAQGISVDPFGITSIPQIAAIGDVALRHDARLGRPVRSEHWRGAQTQATRLAETLMGGHPSTLDVPWSWSHQYDHDIQVTGDCVGAEQTIIRGDRQGAQFCALYLRDRKVVGAFGLNAGRDIRGAMRLIETGAEPALGDLADTTTDLRRMASVA
ncbi:hypothetical protein CH260_15415 [Rhodococcus sp. 05-2256-B2]|uniref:NAD(P)/FAD-dependent oxidoreductase n=1 Tax=unclassified Rhodococcus (in: high G+C Gram-positive bacteria) TaxID=192944 RepID=UPI000B9A777A|nr:MULTISPECIES: FAD-dependent oxidoreductase [unclassified Rhodococcus (in: high G+C Gram-positive bacteria)]MBY4383821.1 FAD-dependent oxidoreductase [Rhodococcus fascians]MBY4399032.1 FAD-dependent oxidoreductase [Rhodococcus fascians]MBY4408570.1 FAD-dependent oxidoreductase [Rhodococcus fascians]MBY4423609.1 FAD-dependent oxidoreductase [Rhodococcus fascians]MBY4462867.1 FAD-dependent oxidoreductase [Rhodococcus fascians]